MGDEHRAPPTRPAGIMVAVNTEAQGDGLAVAVLRDSAARMIERADGAWRSGKWVDFDPLRPPDIVASRVPDAAHGAPR
jgi:hypothetical protein